MMTITLTPDTEILLKDKANREGVDLNSAADRVIREALEWEAQERLEMLEGIRRGLEDSDAGRVRPADEVFAEMREKLRAANR